MSDSKSRIQVYFEDYADHHQTRGNEICHFLGVPLITITVLGLLGELPIGQLALGSSDLFRLDGGTLLLALSILWYLFLDWKLAISFSLFASGLYFIGRSIPTPALWGLFVLGWIIQYVGHLVYEKKSPAFYRNLQHLLIGPLWVFARWIGYDAAQFK